MTTSNPETPKIKLFHSSSLDLAIQKCKEADYRALYAPEVADGRIAGTITWEDWYSTPSILAKGITKKGNLVAVHAHVNHHLADPANIRAAKADTYYTLFRIPQEEFQRLVDLDNGETVIVNDFRTLAQSSEYGEIQIEKALHDKQLIASLGGARRAERYLQAYAQRCNTNTIRTYFPYTWERPSPYTPLASFIFIDHDRIFADMKSEYDSRLRTEWPQQVVGIHDAGPTLDDILCITKDLVPSLVREELNKRLEKAYRFYTRE